MNLEEMQELNEKLIRVRDSIGARIYEIGDLEYLEKKLQRDYVHGLHMGIGIGFVAALFIVMIIGAL